MIKNTLVAALLASIAATSIGSAQAGWRDDAMMAAGMASVAAGTAAALADGDGYHRSAYRPRPTSYRMRPVSDCCYERVQWRRVPAYAPY